MCQLLNFDLVKIIFSGNFIKTLNLIEEYYKKIMGNQVRISIIKKLK